MKLAKSCDSSVREGRRKWAPRGMSLPRVQQQRHQSEIRGRVRGAEGGYWKREGGVQHGSRAQGCRGGVVPLSRTGQSETVLFVKPIRVVPFPGCPADMASNLFSADVL